MALSTSSTVGCAGNHRCGQRHVVTQLRRQHLLQLGDGPLGSVADALSAGGTNQHREGERLVGVEHQRRHRRTADTEPVAAARTRFRVDLVPELAQPIDVAAHRSDGHVQAIGQLGAGPRRSRLQCGEHAEQTAGRSRHSPFCRRTRTETVRIVSVRSSHGNDDIDRHRLEHGTARAARLALAAPSAATARRT